VAAADVGQVQGLIEALGARNDEIEVITRNGDAQWSVGFDEDTVVTLDLVADQAKLVLSAPLGRPPTEQRLAAYEAMLSYNMLWLETGGVTMGLGGAHGELVQLFELNAADDDLTLDLLDVVLVNFAEKARMWRRVIAEGSFGESATTAAAATRVVDQREFMIRA
jgi:hypothetical protein